MNIINYQINNQLNENIQINNLLNDPIEPQENVDQALFDVHRHQNIHQQQQQQQQAVNDENNWNPMEWDRAAEDLTWDRV